MCSVLLKCRALKFQVSSRKTPVWQTKPRTRCACTRSRAGRHRNEAEVDAVQDGSGAQVDNTFVHSSYGFRYLTLFVSNLNASIEQANKNGGKLVAKTPVPLPEGFPPGMGLAIYRDPDGNMVELVVSLEEVSSLDQLLRESATSVR